MNKVEIGACAKLFERGGYVLDFSTADFDAFTMDSVGVALCGKYNMSKGKSLLAYLRDATIEDAKKLLSDLMLYYETGYRDFEKETNENAFESFPGQNRRSQYLKCKSILQEQSTENVNQDRVKALEDAFSSEYMTQQFQVMIKMQDENPTEAIGKAKELIESCCKTILLKKSIAINKDWTFQQLVSKTCDALNILPYNVDEKLPIAQSLKQLYGNIKGLAGPIAEIRNAFGSGHGRSADFEGLDKRHAHLLVGICITLVDFLWLTFLEEIK